MIRYQRGVIGRKTVLVRLNEQNKAICLNSSLLKASKAVD
ncbi:hypothetical protein HMPREF3214_00952 [Alloscardovia omnicolens]|nr:hypothetical protein HMPREF3214_00952 [Alloscardovia omnicolens]